MLVNKLIVIIGSDVYENKNALYMAKILSVLQQEGRIDVILIHLCQMQMESAISLILMIL